MRDREHWTLHTANGEVVVSLDVMGTSAGERPPDVGERALIEGWLMMARNAGSARIQLVEVARTLTRGVADPWRSLDAERVVREAFLRHRLRITRRPERVPHGRRDAFDHDGTRARHDVLHARKTWIGIRLVERDAPSRGVPNARYVLTLPDGSERIGRTDREGRARVDEIDPGTCKVVFPDYTPRPTALPAQPPQGFTRRRPAPPPAAPPPQQSGALSSVAVSSTCRAIALRALDARGAALKRQPDERRVLQVVPVATRRELFETGLPLNAAALGKMGDAAGNVGQVAQALHEYGLQGGLTALAVKDAADEAKKKRAAQSAPATGAPKHKWAATLKGVSDRYRDGIARVRLDADTQPGCEARHPVRYSGTSFSRQTVDAAPADLRWIEGGTPWWGAVPTTYSARTQGCSGSELDVRVEVFPPDSRLLAGSFEARAAPVGDWFKTVSSALENWIGASLDVSCVLEGRVEYFQGWREDEASWRVYLAEEFRLRFAPRVEAKASLSFLQLVAHVPKSFTKYAADVGAIVGADVGLLASGEGAHRRYPSDASLSRYPVKGSLHLTGKFTVGLYGQVGSKDVLGVVVTGTVNGELKAGGSIGYDRGTFTAKTEVEFGEIRAQVKILSRALFWKSEDSWDWILREKQRPKALNMKLFEINRS